jgi:hypothetical protein
MQSFTLDERRIPSGLCQTQGTIEIPKEEGKRGEKEWISSQLHGSHFCFGSWNRDFSGAHSTLLTVKHFQAIVKWISLLL